LISDEKGKRNRLNGAFDKRYHPSIKRVELPFSALCTFEVMKGEKKRNVKGR
jgi:hypothetical protein